jgi:Alginate export
MRKGAWRLALGPLLSSGIGSFTLSAQSDAMPSRPPYELIRYDEDWSVVRDPRLRTDWWDRIKYIPIGRGSYLSLGGDLRLRYEAYQNPGFGADPPDPAGYLLQRYLVHADLHPGRRLRVFFQVQASGESGRAGGPRALDADALEVHQLFAELRVSSGPDIALRAGRQELEFGSSRLISAHENFNVRQSFDAARLLLHAGRWLATAWVARPLRVSRGAFDDAPDSTRVLWGGSFTRVTNLGLWTQMGVFYVGLHDDRGRFDQGVAEEHRHTFGVRVRRLRGMWDSNLEGSVQVGRFGSGQIRAWDIGADNGVTFPAPLLPRFGIRFDATSGDSDPGVPDLQTFNALFPNTAYSGLAGLVGPANSIDLTPSLRIEPARRLTLTTGVAIFWRESTRDALYNVQLAPIRTGASSRASHVGTQMTFELGWRPSSHVTYSATYTRFISGEFLHQTPPGQNVRFVMTWVSYRF